MKPAPGRLPLSAITVLEAIDPEGDDTSDELDSIMNAVGPALALYQSIMWSTGEDDDKRKDIRDAAQLLRYLDALNTIMADLGRHDYSPTADNLDPVSAVALCITLLLAFLRIAPKTDAELAGRFRVEIPGGAR